MCCEDRKSFPKSSLGRPPVPDGLAQRIIFRVPPDLGVTSVGVAVGEGEVAVEVVALVAVVVVVVPEEQPTSKIPITSSAVKRAMILFIFLTPQCVISNLTVCFRI